MCLFAIKKISQWKTHFTVKENLVCFPEKCFPFIFGGKHFPEIMKKIRNIILFAYYNKFGP